MGKQGKYPAEVRKRAVRLVLDHQGEYDSQWAAITSIAGKVGCSPESLRKWIRQAERDSGKRDGVSGSRQTLRGESGVRRRSLANHTL